MLKAELKQAEQDKKDAQERQAPAQAGLVDAEKLLDEAQSEYARVQNLSELEQLLNIKKDGDLTPVP